MKRRIGFRGMDIKNKWHCGLLSESVGFPNQPEIGFYISNMVGAPWAFRVLRDSISEYTGLYDRNNKKIWESDIVQCFDFECKSCRYEVIHQNGAFGYIAKYIGFIAFAENHNFRWENGMSEHIEVIGNRFSNSELVQEVAK